MRNVFEEFLKLSLPGEMIHVECKTERVHAVGSDYVIIRRKFYLECEEQVSLSEFELNIMPDTIPDMKALKEKTQEYTEPE